MMENLLEISNLTKKYGHEKILSDLNLSIPKNSIIGLIGENGSGKTTLMKCISDIIPSYRKNFLIQNWMRNRNTLEFIGLLETLNNPNFNRVQFDTFRNESGLNRFTMTPSKWIESTGAIGIVSKSGRYGGTYAHYDIVMEFASWLSPEFKLYIIQDYKRLKEDENSKLSLTWNLHREISNINYKIHTDEQLSFKYASEADMLNVALFNKRAKQWREENPDLKGNMRDYASLNELLVLANMESYNAILIEKGLEQRDRMIELRNLAKTQLISLEKLNQLDIKNYLSKVIIEFCLVLVLGRDKIGYFTFHTNII